MQQQNTYNMQNSLIINLALDMPTLETAFRSHYPNYTDDELISVLDNVRASYQNIAADIIGYYDFDVYKLSLVGWGGGGTVQLIISENPSPINEFCLRDMYTDGAQFEADKQAYIRELSMLRECLHRLIADAGLRTFTGGMLTSSSGSIRFETEVNSFAAVETVIDDMAVHAKARRFSA